MIGSRALTADLIAAKPTRRSDERQTQRLFLSAAVSALIAIDVLVVSLSFAVAYLLRVGAVELGPGLLANTYVRTGASVGLIAALLLVLQGLADVERHRSWPVRVRAITTAVSTGTVVGILAAFDGNQTPYRGWVAIGWSLAIGGLAAWRTVAPAAYVRLRQRVFTRPRAVVVGANALGRDLARELEARFDVLGYVDNGTDLGADSDRQLLAPIAELDSIVRTHGVSEIIVALPPDRREQVTKVIARGFGREVDVKIVPELGEHLPRRLELGRFGSRTYIGYAPVARVTWIKRGMDLLIASALLCVTAPLFALIALAIRVDTPGPAIYRQRRVGKDGVGFDIYKFRSMCVGAEDLVATLIQHNEASGPLFKIRRDPRVTRVGELLRRLSLDELPQLINVMKGEMSLVGPRPPLPSEVERYEDWQMGRLRALPGMTGLWQVSGRSEVPFNDMIRLDLHYVRNWSLGMDVEILWRTIPAVLAKSGAY